MLLCSDSLAEDFNKYFSRKHSKIRSGIKEKVWQNNFEYTDILLTIPNAAVDTFKLLDTQSGTELIKAASTRSCELNPIPTTLLKANLKEKAPMILK